MIEQEGNVLISEKIAQTMLDIAKLLNSHGEIERGGYFEQRAHQFQRVEAVRDKQELVRESLQVFRGAQSFNDIVLYSDGLLDRDATSTLHRLSTELFETLRDEL